MKNFISKISKDALVSSSVALMMQELHYYSLCPYWYDKFGQKYDTSISRDTPMYMCECYTLENVTVGLFPNIIFHLKSLKMEVYIISL